MKKNKGKSKKGNQKNYTMGSNEIMDSSGYGFYGSLGQQIIQEPFTGAWQHNVYAKKDDATQNYAYFSCLTLIANDLSNMDLEVQKQDRKNKVWENDYSRKYRYLHQLIEHPNSFQNSQDFIANWSHSLNQFGNTYCFIDWDGEVPIGMYILDPNKVSPIVTEDGDVYYRVIADKMIGLKQDFIFSQKEILHHRINTLFHPLCGIPPLWAAAIHAYSSIEQGKTSFDFYKNAARPSALLIAPNDISQEDVKALKENYAEAMSGRRHAGKMMVLSGGLQYQQLTMSAEDQQLIELLKFNAEAICACFHVPPHMVLGTAPSYNNIEALKQDYFQRALQFIITGIEKNLHRSLGLHNLDDELWVQFNTDSLLRMDKATRYKVHGQAIKDGWINRNEVRAKEDLPPVDGGDLILVQAQDTTIKAIEVRDERFIAMETTPQAVIPTQLPTEPVKPVAEEDELVDNTQDEVERFFNYISEKYLT